ncbi:MAG: hypothetical protein ACRCZH_01885 [Cetobacterium sp.]
MMWTFSFSLLLYKSEVSEIHSLKLSNDIYWELENISKIAEYEVFKGDSAIKLEQYKDILEYFEDYDLVWRKPNYISKSGYQRYVLVQNNKFISGEVILEPLEKNILEIKLVKEILVERKKIEVIINIYYEYSRLNTDFFKSNKREIKGVEAKIKNEDIRN